LVYGIGDFELYRTESLRAIIAEEFLESGNWIVPRLYGEPLFTKPPGMYAAIALASWPFGEVTEWSARLPSVIAASVVAFVLFGLFRRYVDGRAALVAAVTFPISLMVLDKAPSAEIDMLQVAWVFGSVACALRAVEDFSESDTKGRIGWWMGALLCVAGGFLTKWTAPAFFYLTLVPFLWSRGNLRALWSFSHLAAVAIGAGVSLAWAGAAIWLEGWETFSHTVKRQAFMHLLPTHHHRPYPWLESLGHPFRIWLAAMPISAFALPALFPGFSQRWDDRGRYLLQAMHCLVWPNLLFWTIVPAHNTRHSFPLYPGIAGLAAFVWAAWLTNVVPWRWRGLTAAKALAIVLGVWIAAKLVFIHYVVPSRSQNREPRAKAARISAEVPNGETLYLFKLKDEGIMFYYARPVRRLAAIHDLPASTEPLYCIMNESEWKTAPAYARPLLYISDEQGDPIVLARLGSADIDATRHANKSKSTDE
jgi:4-amino-4-deoxy-L-arabinose transferase-like glycosyltransferase